MILGRVRLWSLARIKEILIVGKICDFMMGEIIVASSVERDNE